MAQPITHVADNPQSPWVLLLKEITDFIDCIVHEAYRNVLVNMVITLLALLKHVGKFFIDISLIYITSLVIITDKLLQKPISKLEIVKTKLDIY
jgi:hypothetical protein